MTERCVGCGLEVAAAAGPVHRYMTAAPQCWALYGERLATLSSDARLRDALIMCVDAYAVQHPGEAGPPAIRSVALHLINMHSYFVAGRAVSPPRPARDREAFHRLTPPTALASRSVADVPVDGTPERIAAAVRDWALAVWEAWREHHAQVAVWAAQSSK